MSDLQSLLSQINAILTAYNKVIKNSSENYNIFKVLNLQTDEVKLHSLFLAELLNPKGSHNKGNLFLKCFIEVVFTDNTPINIENVTLEIEKFIGPVSQDKNTGGRIDIYLEDHKGNCLIIENKIYAGDQEKQLQRYFNYKGNRQGAILYLTLDGKSPSKISCCDLIEGKDFQLISYNFTILSWLEKCHQIASDSPFVRETIRQYINLIKSFSGQTILKEMYKDFKSIILQTPQNFESAFQIEVELKNIKIDLLVDFWEEVYQKLKEKLGNEYKISYQKDKIKGNANYPGMWVNKNNYSNDPCQFVLEPLNGNSLWNKHSLYYGIWINGNEKIVQQKSVELRKLFDQKLRNSSWWLDYIYVKNLYFNGKETLKSILPGTESRSKIQERIVVNYSEYIIKNEDLMSRLINILT
ncbi:PD-(D/E)XK nuclease family protein [Mucilaginibacter galii]|uniref:PD-(D/E)XK nuclease superfamily protein n=1 Tax=Mucilaginibacter galii TaxID=2005073 RepID=A0A917MZY6_9SPHI|nr:PD-(D/E)XK nuclease family protein [Mucilaginibacter galii]GGI49235.1 hypothetical protein GCM10011425_04470 [Mucilaginibacter galii]